ncbi:MAG: flagellar basal body P-ring formation protein FlgA [Spirochaeta sp.]|nr:flagellar basal body P-ring formation protein FlgA [Spirochaeta sp.]
MIRFLFSVLLLFSASALSGLEVYLKRLVRVETPVVRLAQIASVVARDPAAAAEIAGIELGPVPEYITLLPVQEIRALLERKIGSELSLIGSRVVMLPADSIPEEEIWFYREFSAFIESSDYYKEGRIEIEILSGAVDSVSLPVFSERKALPAQPLFFRMAAADSNNSYLSGKLEVLYREATSPQEKKILIWVHHFLPVAHAAYELKAGTKLQDYSLKYKERDISLLSGEALVKGEHEKDFKILSRVQVDEPIMKRSLAALPMVRAGDPVKILFKKRGIIITMAGRAQASGTRGSIIYVSPLSTGKRFSALVTGEKEVEVEIP